MKRKCSRCGKTDHRASNTAIHPKPGVAAATACGYCHRPKTDHAASCKRATGGGRHSRPPRKARAMPADLPTNGVRETARTLLGQLEALRAKLETKIATVRELAELL